MKNLISENVSIENGIENLIYNNINACLKLKDLIFSSFGPFGKKKMLFNKERKLTLTSETSTIFESLKFIHPSSKLITSYIFYQDKEFGDGSGLLFLLSCEILEKSLYLIKKGFFTYQLINCLKNIEKISLKILEQLAIYKIKDASNFNTISSILSVSFFPLIQEQSYFISPQVAYACIKIINEKNFKLSYDNIRVVKILGGDIKDTKTIAGSVLLKDSENNIKNIEHAKIVIFISNFDFLEVETKKKMRINKWEDILELEKIETRALEKKVYMLRNKGINLVIASSFSEKSIYFLNKHQIMAIKINSKFDLQRIAKTTNSIVLTKFKVPDDDEIGYCKKVYVKSLETQKITIFQQNFDQCELCTILLRGNTNVILNNLEKCVFKGISLFKSIMRDERFVPGNGLTEYEIFLKLLEYSNKSINSEVFITYSECFKNIHKYLINLQKDLRRELTFESYFTYRENVNLHSQNQTLKKFPYQKSVKIWDHYSTKYWSIKNAFECSSIILMIDQVIMSKE
ncbi:chaperonin-containing-TCP1 theta subunit [Guillardia theta]|uniref:Chaperonin-containing-TCP1 theta subunit n=1 Tax=Guillardia theta TaxID=55529 RepID=Q9AW47_GUITH|nr:chaperonin-containing-TCP1 theta subunit [Guillardia theta]CAC27023.1 chaperonin-containing-TCP1 theta subunit [Guillardia theta]|mmetsp:Transcript_17293/g.57208  ORF Transcript_17293/g.57208 Transcript_17293/m.57208 type:complete len:516 (+) Transcript_17293:1364-2911(+)